jgi:hypothetical protein
MATSDAPIVYTISVICDVEKFWNWNVCDSISEARVGLVVGSMFVCECLQYVDTEAAAAIAYLQITIFIY